MRKKWILGTCEVCEYYGRNTGKKLRGSLSVAVEVELSRKPKGLSLSICGMTYYPGARDIESGGQCVDELKRIIRFADGFDAAKVARIAEIWERWHLNDMRAGCEHQRSMGDALNKPVTLINWKWTKRYYSMRANAEHGKLSVDEYKKYSDLVPRVEPLLFGMDRPRWEAPECLKLEREGWIERGDTKTEAANWVPFKSHPDGMLSRPCAHCGYEYGSQWLHEEIPQSIIDELVALFPGLEVPELATA